MKKIISIAGLVSASAISLGVAAASTPVAQASSVPRIQTQPTGWHGHGWKIRPGAVYFGGGASFAAPRSRHLHWTSWGHARGQWFIDSCRPDCAKGGRWVSARFHFYDTHSHAGPGRYFSNVKVSSRQTVRGWPTHLWIVNHGRLGGDWNWR